MLQYISNYLIANDPEIFLSIDNFTEIETVFTDFSKECVHYSHRNIIPFQIIRSNADKRSSLDVCVFAICNYECNLQNFDTINSIMIHCYSGSKSATNGEKIFF